MKTEPKQARLIKLKTQTLHIENKSGAVTITPLEGGGMMIMAAPDIGFEIRQTIVDGYACQAIAKPETFERLEKDQVKGGTIGNLP